MSNLEFVKKCASKYGVDSISKKLASVEGCATMNIGFVGPFSSGKTSLINSLMGVDLPVNIEPTTKAICIIECDPALPEGEKVYYRDNGEVREQIDFLEFSNILRGRGDGDCALAMPPKGLLQANVSIIDTPGIDSLGVEEKMRTYSYLAMMDAAVVCTPVSDGTLKESVRNFICSSELRPFAGNLVFALTKSDSKAPTALEAIREKFVMELKECVNAGLLPIENVEDRVVVVNRRDVAERLIGCVQNQILPMRHAAVARRSEAEVCRIAGELALILRDRSNVMKFDDGDNARAIDETERDLAALMREADDKAEELKKLYERLRSRISDALFNCKRSVVTADGADVQSAAVGAMLANVKMEVEAFCSRYVQDFSCGEVLGRYGDDLAGRLATIDRTKNVAVMASTAVATAFIAPGASVAANAGEAAAGAVAQVGARQAAIEGAKTAARSATKVLAVQAAKGAAKEASKGALKGFLAKCAGTVATVIHDINPIEHIGDYLAGKFKESSFDESASTMSALIAGRVMDSFQEEYKANVLEPIQRRIEEKRNSVMSAREARKSGIINFRAEAEQIDLDIAELTRIGGCRS